MSEPLPKEPATSAQHRLQHEVLRRAERKRRARKQERKVWFWMGMFGLVGWSVAIPTVIGVAAGLWIDRHWPSEVSWTLTLLIVGVIVGCLNAWYWVQQESHRE